MVVQAGGARRIMDRDPRACREAAAHIEDTGREALAEMRRLLGVLHHGDDEPRAPQPACASSTGSSSARAPPACRCRFTVEGEPRSLPAGVDLPPTASCRRR